MLYLSDILKKPYILDIDPADINYTLDQLPVDFNISRPLAYGDFKFELNNNNITPIVDYYVSMKNLRIDENNGFFLLVDSIIVPDGIDQYGVVIEYNDGTNVNTEYIQITANTNSISMSGFLSPNTSYTIRYRTYAVYDGEYKYGKWSDYINITTPNVSISTPVITLKDSDGNILDPNTLLGNGIVVNVSGFNIVGSNEPLDHVEVTVSVDDNSNSYISKQEGDIITLDNLLESKTYTITARFYTANYTSGDGIITFTTKQYFLDTPIVEIPTNINENSTVTGKISNYNSNYMYDITVNIGKVTNNGDGTFTYKSIDITDGVNHSDKLTVTVTDGVYHGEPVVKDLTIVYLPLVADDGIQITAFETDINKIYSEKVRLI